MLLSELVYNIKWYYNQLIFSSNSASIIISEHSNLSVLKIISSPHKILTPFLGWLRIVFKQLLPAIN